MSLLRDYDSLPPLTDFPGADTRRDEVTKSIQTRAGAIVARNVEFPLERVQTARGFAEFFVPDSPNGMSIESMYNWLKTDRNILLLFSKNGGSPKVFQKHLDLGTEDDIVTGLSSSVIDAVFAATGARAIMAFLNSNGGGQAQGWIFKGTFTGAADAVELFIHPPLEAGSAGNFTASVNVSAGTGVVTAGQHNIGLIFRSIVGYDTLPVVLASSPFTAPGGQFIRVTLTPASTWPAWIKEVQAIMTSTSNPAEYFFVPNADGFSPNVSSVPAGTSGAVTIDINIDDAPLNAGESAKEYFFLLTQDSGGSGPFNPKFVGTYGQRMAYLADIPDAGSLGNVSTFYFSEPGKPEHITADFHGRTMPGLRPMVGGFQMGGVYYMLGPSWTFAVRDNQDKPVTWAGEAVISGRIGTSSAHGFDIDVEGGTAWVADRHGLYLFEGTRYQELPISFTQGFAEWSRINWDAPPSRVWVADNRTEQVVAVAAPLDSAVEPSHILMWNYSRGRRWDRVNFSLRDIAATTIMGSLIVGNLPSASSSARKLMPEFWVSSAEDQGKVYRQKSVEAGDGDDEFDEDLYDDDGEGITSVYRAPTPQVATAPMVHGAVRLRVRGNGALKVKAYSYDQTRNISMSDVTLARNPGEDVLRKFNMRSEAVNVEVSNDGVAGNFWVLSRLQQFWKSWVLQR